LAVYWSSEFSAHFLPAEVDLTFRSREERHMIVSFSSV
jgi:hypothetical protein